LIGFPRRLKPLTVGETAAIDLDYNRADREKNGAGEMLSAARTVRRLAGPVLLGTLAALALSSSAGAQVRRDYRMTVNADRLLGAQNESQNWLMMNGDYAGTRYSRLTQINRDTVKGLRMAWALALGGMADVGPNGPENETNPLVDNGFMYTGDGWGTVYKIDARDAGKGDFV
jgi:alcohol dehydrogenase (cytochrome c)